MNMKNEDNDSILIVALWCSRVAWCLLELAHTLSRRPYLFLAPSASTGHQESIIRKKGNGVCAIEPVWLLCLGAQCLCGRWEGALAPIAGTRAYPILLIFIRQRARVQEQHKRGRGGESVDFYFFLFMHMWCQNFDRARALAKACRAGAPCLTRIHWMKGHTCKGAKQKREG